MPSTFARKLRADATEAEIRLWSKLRRKQLAGFRFRRQQPMGRFIVDFFCPEAQLIVEVDGGQHADESPARADWLKRRGYRVLRFWNNEVLANTEGVVETILDVLKSPPTHLRHSPQATSPSRGEGALLRHTGNSESPRAIALSKKETPPPLRGRSQRDSVAGGGGDVRCR